MHVIPEEAIEVAHLGIPEALGDLADLFLWEKPQQRKRKLKPHLYLTSAHILPVPSEKVALERPLLDPGFGRDHPRTELYISMLGLDKVIDQLYRIVERVATRVTRRQPSAVLDLCDNLAFNRTLLLDQTSGHAEFLKAKSQQSPQGALEITSQRDCILRQITSDNYLIGGPRLLHGWQRASIWRRVGFSHDRQRFILYDPVPTKPDRTKTVG